ncbi:MAG: DUF4465 domain-containing protein [Planctomycetaceae bacterium]|nr:DUF4465 domain-containing protein [Planctomycetaceae bacterium]
MQRDFKTFVAAIGRWVLCFLAVAAIAPGAARAGVYAPAAGVSGSTAISKDSDQFVEWASECTVTRGLQNISNPGLGYASYGVASAGTGKADNGVVSLGDGGYAVLTFDRAITNGDGYDFAVFENAFNDTFLELAFVEVSTDGANYFRFPSVSQTSTDSQVGSFGSVDATNLYDLAGKYRVYYGTPFDLDELVGVSDLLDVDNVRYVKVVDVVGSIADECAAYDSLGNKVNDPWPTGFASSGFDLDAVGVIYQVPEPGALALLLAGVGFWFYRRRRSLFFARGFWKKGENFMWWKKTQSGTAILAWFVLIAAAKTCPATVIDFEDLGQPPTAYTIDGSSCGYYWNGDDGSSGFTSGGAEFNNLNSGSGWSGFAYSNANYTDSSKSDPTCQFAAAAGDQGHGNYAIGYGCSSCVDLFGGVLATVTIPDGMEVVSAMFTNTTYAAASMLHGDGFTEAFTSDDWFLLTVTGQDALGGVTGTVDFYLAQNGSVLTAWETVDLTSLGDAATLVFDLTSSDTGAWGMNTPAYFAMDNLVLASVPEPSTLALLTTASFGAVWLLRRRRA